MAHYYRPTEPPTHGYRTHLANLLSTLSIATGAVSNVTVVLDGGKFEPKAAEHARRDSASVSRADLLADAAAKDALGQFKEADDLYRKLVYPVPPFVDSWIIAHCRENGFPLIVAPYEADSQAARLVTDNLADVLVTNDSDLLFYPGVPRLLIADGKKLGTWWEVSMSDIIGKQLGMLCFVGFTEFDMRSVALAVGCDYAPRVYHQGWKSVVDLYRGIAQQCKLQFGQPALREKLIEALIKLNDRQGAHRHDNYEDRLRHAYTAFDAPVAWQPVPLSGITWPAEHDAIKRVQLVGATSLCDKALTKAKPADALALCRGDVYARTYSSDVVLATGAVTAGQRRELPDLSADDNPAAAHVSNIKPLERGAYVDGAFQPRGLRKYKKEQLVAWLTAKLSAPLSPDTRDSLENLYVAVSCALEIEETQGLDTFRPLVATLGALSGWTTDDGTLHRRPDEAITDLSAVFAFVRDWLPKIGQGCAAQGKSVNFRFFK